MKKVKNILILLISGGLIPFFSLAQVPFTTSNLPILIIDTQGNTIVDEPKVPSLLGVIDNGAGMTNTVTDPPNDYDGHIGIEYRGSSSQFLFPKKSYGFETRDSVGANNNVSLLGMAIDNDWVLHGPYSDKSLLRNVVTMMLGRDLDRYASRTRLVEVVINGDYMGVYVLMEKVKRDGGRVDIDRLDPAEISGDQLTGGYIVKLDKFDGGNSGAGWTSPFAPPNKIYPDQVIFFQFDYPKAVNIAPEQAQYIEQVVTDFENALNSTNFDDPVTGYPAHIDEASFVDFFIMMELTRNVDAYRLSTFLHKDRDSIDNRLKLGPIWDFNLAFGNANYCDGWKTTGWAYDFNNVCNGDFWLNPFWWDKFLTSSRFRFQLRSRWDELRAGVFSNAKIMTLVDSLANELNEPQARNFDRWPVLGLWVWPNQFVGTTYQQEVDYMKDWITDRLAWLDANMPAITTGIEDEVSTPSMLTIFPNPTSGEFRVLVDATTPPGRLEIFDVSGHKVGSFAVRPGTSFNFGAKLRAGMYLYNLVGEGRVAQSGRLIKR